ncbi:MULTISPECIES: primosomal protein N' [Cysteiniphilum]|uniref:Replication restart protein PriA n=1 Tax=Cysteiniphilum litorale TaxID=2056700 RepID=A0A8J2Z621_9GAMM|nr:MULTISPECIES: primosomal protein N' [Cysteiniphilum]GGG04404.1 primosomal protein N' [Cysteiniphilum litorale]
MAIVRVLVHGPFTDGLDYLYSVSTPPIPFTRVIVPLGTRKVIGVISEINPKVSLPKDKLKSIVKVLDQKPLLSTPAIDLIKWLAHYYQCTLYQSLRLSLPKHYLQKEQPECAKQIIYTLNNTDRNDFKPAKNAHKQHKALALLREHGSVSHDTFISHEITLTTIKSLINKNIITQSKHRLFPTTHATTAITPRTLTNAQQSAVDAICQHLHHFKTFLLFGVTGSGKTEVYIEAIKPVIQSGKQVLVLVPEINLTPQTLMRFEQNFNEPIAAIHSQLTDQARFELFVKVQNAEINIIIATRSGLLFDTPNLGMIIVDEEHDASYKQQNIPTYHARDIAIVKAQKYNIPIILGSGTPSLESYYHASNGKYHLLTLKNRALNQISNQVHIINLQKSKTQAGLSPILIDKIKQTIANNEQVLLFINRRGFAHSLICQDCGWCANCNQCEKPYTLHTKPQHLACHFCGKAREIILQCPNCQSHNLSDIGQGTEKLEDELTALLPNAHIARLDRSSTQKKGALEDVLNDIKSQHIDIIVGTQMIAKGHDFQNVSLVGIINADAGFYSQDFHAVERTAQLIIQVAGRTGRGSKPGDVYIQTYQPDNPILQLILQTDYKKFLEHSLETRKLLSYPPFSYQAYIYAQASKTQTCTHALQQLNHALVNCNEQKKLHCQISHVLPAINIKQAGHYRFMLMLTAGTRKQLKQLLNAVSNDIKLARKKVKITIDIDPIDIK